MAQEVIVQVFALGQWHKVMQGTLRVDGGTFSGILSGRVYTWLDPGSKVRYYARAEDILGLRTEVDHLDRY
jgi:hypothetical protein